MGRRLTTPRAAAVAGLLFAGLFTAVGPIAGSYLTQYWTWRAIFWINVPVALLSLTEFALVKLDDVKNPAPIDWGGAVLSVAGMGLTVLGIQQSSVWGWGSVATIGSIVAGVLLLVYFVIYENRQTEPLIDVYRDRKLLVEVDGMGEVEEVTARILDQLDDVDQS